MSEITAERAANEAITLDRTGLPPLSFVGRLIANANGQFVGSRSDRPNVHWFDVSVYRVGEATGHGPRATGKAPTDAGQFASKVLSPLAPRPSPLFVVAVTYRKQFKGALTERRQADVCDDPAEWLAAFEPLVMVQGFPPGERFAERQRRLNEALALQFGTLTSAVLREFPATVSTGN